MKEVLATIEDNIKKLETEQSSLTKRREDVSFEILSNARVIQHLKGVLQSFDKSSKSPSKKTSSFNVSAEIKQIISGLSQFTFSDVLEIFKKKFPERDVKYSNFYTSFTYHVRGSGRFSKARLSDTGITRYQYTRIE